MQNFDSVCLEYSNDVWFLVKILFTTKLVRLCAREEQVLQKWCSKPAKIILGNVDIQRHMYNNERDSNVLSVVFVEYYI